MPQIVVSGLTPDDKDPGFYAQNKPGAGPVNVGEVPLKVVLFGNTTAGATITFGTMTACNNEDDAATFCGAQSELARMAYAALEVPGSVVYLAPVTEASGSSATATITIGGTWTTAGQITFQLDEQIFTVNFDLTVTSVTLAANAVVAEVNVLQNGRFFCNAANSLGVTTLTTANKGIRNNQHTLFVVDKTLMPPGMTVTIAGGTALSNGGVPFTGGAGTDDVTAAITALDSIQLDYIGVAHNDSTNCGVFEAHANAKEGAEVGLLDQYVVSGNGSQAAAIAIAQTQMNDQLGQFVWVPLGVEHPSRVAAKMAALRSITEDATPNANYNKVPIPGAAPHFRPDDSPTHAVRKAALNAGITPCMTINGQLVIVRSINSHSLNGSSPDYRTLDSSDTTVPFRVRKELAALYDDAQQKNPYAGPDLTDGLPPEGRFTPRLWLNIITAAMKDWEIENWVTDVDDNPSVTEWDPDGKRVMSATPVLVALHNNQVGALINQVPA